MMEGLTPRLIRAWLRVVIFVLFASASFLLSSTTHAQGTIFDNPLSPTSPANITPPPSTPTINPDGSISRPPLSIEPSILQPGTGPNVNNPTGGQTVDTDTQGDAVGSESGTPDKSSSVGATIPSPITAGSCWTSPGAVMNCIVVAGLGSLTAAFGWAFDESIRLFILDFGNLYLNSGLGNSVEGLWETVRDIFNLTFIFGLVYIGFQIILGVNESGARRTIPFLVIAALLVNFSLFITKLIIDFANLAATQIFSLFTVSSQGATSINSVTDGVSGYFLGNGETPSIALGFMNQLGVSALLNYQVTDSSPFLYLLGVAVVFIVMIYVFALGAVLISIRFAVLIFYIIFSPVMFLGWVFPGFKSTTDKFWAGLFGQAFFAPAFLFMLYVTYTLTVNFNAAGRESLVILSSQGGNLDTTQTFASILPYFILIVIFLLGSLSIARKMANAGSSGVMKINDWATGKMRGALVGAGVGGAGYLGYKTLDKTASSDSRLVRYTGLGSLSRGISKYTGVRDAAEKAYKNSYIGTSVAAREKRTGELATRKSQATLSATIGKKPDGVEEQIKFEQAITDASTSQIIKELESANEGGDEYRRIVKALSPTQVSKILESKDDEFSPAQKTVFYNTRKKSVEERLTSPAIGSSKEDIESFYKKNPDAKKRLSIAIERDASVDDLKQLGLDTLRANAAYITASKMDDLKGKLSPTEWGILNSERKKALIDKYDITSSTVDPDKRKSVFTTAGGSSKKDNEIARLPREILIHPDVVNYINPKVLELVLKENYLSAEDRETIKGNIGSITLSTKKERFDKFFDTPLGQTF